MTFQFIGQTHNKSSGDTTPALSVSVPAGIQAGDLLLGFVVYFSDKDVRTKNAYFTGFTQIRSDYSYDSQYENTCRLVSFYKVADGTETSATVGMSSGGLAVDMTATLVAYRGVSTITPVDASAGWNALGSSTVVNVPQVASPSGGLLVGLYAANQSGDETWTPPSGLTERVDYQGGGPPFDTVGAADATVAAGPGIGGLYALLSAAAFQRVAQAIVLRSANQPPSTPILTAPTDGAGIDRNSTQRFDWDFSDPDPGDSQSKYDLRYRVTGTSTWTDVSGTTPNTYHDFAAGTFASGDYEWQVRTYDAQGEVGPWSSSAFFTAADAPSAPTITSPVNGGTFLQTQPVEWSTPVQDAYQIQVRDTGDAVLYDSGEVGSSTARSTTVPFPDNGTTRKLRLRVKDGGLWSPWYEITGTVSWLAPPAPVVSLLPDGDSGALLVTVTNPAPTGAEPAAAYNQIRANDGDGFDYKAGSRMVAVNSTWTYHLAVIGRDYAGNVEVTAVADNGVTATTTA